MLLLIGCGTLLLAERVAQGAVLRNALRTGEAVSVDIVAPLVDTRVRAAEQGAAAELNQVMSDRMVDGSVVRLKVWSTDGVIIWSDDQRLVGQQFDLEPADAATLATLGSTAEVSELDREENVFERDAGQLIEVYVGVVDSSGEPLLVEAYLPTAPLEAEATSLMRTLLPVTIGALFVLLLVMLPLAVSMARSVDRAGKERVVLLRHAVASATLERRRIAGDLHDEVVQDLAGIGYALPGITAGLAGRSELDGARRALTRITGIVHRDVATLRSMIAEIYPVELSGGGLLVSLQQLAAHTQLAGPHVRLQVDIADASLPPETTTLVHRIVREGLRNVARHAHASTAHVLLEQRGPDLLVEVVDDGVGFDGPIPHREGHVGLRLLVDLVHDLGGTCDVTSADGRGTRLAASFPAEWTETQSRW